MIVGIDHRVLCDTRQKHVSFPSGIIEYDYEPYTMQNVLTVSGKVLCLRYRETDAGKK